MTKTAVVTRVVLIAIYLASTVLAVVAIYDGHANQWQTNVWLGMAVVLGAGTGQLYLAVLPVVAIPIAIPFGVPNIEADPAFPLWMHMLYWSSFSAFLIAVASLVRLFFASRRRKA